MQTKSREIVGAFIFSKDGMILLGKNKPGGVYEGLWTIPGGGVEEGEDIITALKREIEEEVGLDITSADIVSLPSKHGESEKMNANGEITMIVKMHFHDYQVMLSRPASAYLLVSGDDFSLARWFNVSEIRDLEIADPAKKTLMSLL